VVFVVIRVIYIVIIANAAVIFAAGWRRGLGLIVLAALVIGPVSARRRTSNRRSYRA
jgi:hypothetical protein